MQEPPGSTRRCAHREHDRLVVRPMRWDVHIRVDGPRPVPALVGNGDAFPRRRVRDEVHWPEWQRDLQHHVRQVHRGLDRHAPVALLPQCCGRPDEYREGRQQGPRADEQPKEPRTGGNHAGNQSSTAYPHGTRRRNDSSLRVPSCQDRLSGPSRPTARLRPALSAMEAGGFRCESTHVTLRPPC